jgi:hypothetical protein
MYLSGVPFEDIQFDTTLQKEPILANAQDFLGQVPMVLSIWPALFLGFHRLATRGGEEKSRDEDKTQKDGPSRNEGVQS